MYKLLLAIGIIVMFIVGTIIGIKFMVSSAEEKAKVKEALVPYVVGCVVIFGAFTIWSMAVNVGQDIVPQPLSVGDEINRQILILITPNEYAQNMLGFGNWIERLTPLYESVEDYDEVMTKMDCWSNSWDNITVEYWRNGVRTYMTFQEFVDLGLRSDLRQYFIIYEDYRSNT